MAAKGEGRAGNGKRRKVLLVKDGILRIISVKYNRRRPWKISQECVFNVDRYTLRGKG